MLFDVAALSSVISVCHDTAGCGRDGSLFSPFSPIFHLDNGFPNKYIKSTFSMRTLPGYPPLFFVTGGFFMYKKIPEFS